MTARIHPLVDSPLTGLVCVACGKVGDTSDLITHTGYRVYCIFHRSCFWNSASVITGKCLGCDASLHGGLLLYDDPIKRL